MKRILLACSILAATLIAGQANAQTTVTKASFTAKANLLDTQIAAGDMDNAKATAKQINDMMMEALAINKEHVRAAPTDVEKAKYMDQHGKEVDANRDIFQELKDLPTNRTILRENLAKFAAAMD